jgi:hypothetical protein
VAARWRGGADPDRPAADRPGRADRPRPPADRRHRSRPRLLRRRAGLRRRRPLRQLSDHGTHEAVYLSDPDGNDLELAWDRPIEEWPRDADGHVVPIFGDLDLDDLLTAR